MRPDERDAAYLWDMLNAAREAHMTVDKLTPDAFLEDWLRRRALERTLEVLGEAARKVSEEFPRPIPTSTGAASSASATCWPMNTAASITGCCSRRRTGACRHSFAVCRTC